MERIEIELGMWEMAPCPICTDNVDLDTAEKLLYQSAVTEWGEKEVENLLTKDGPDEYSRKWERFQEWLCAEEEAIVIECGGIYYEDMCDEEKIDMSKTLKIIADYCLENVWNFEERVQMALTKIDHWRCPLSQADRTLYSDIQNAIEDCGTDYELDIDGIDPEEIIWL